VEALTLLLIHAPYTTTLAFCPTMSFMNYFTGQPC